MDKKHIQEAYSAARSAEHLLSKVVEHLTAGSAGKPVIEHTLFALEVAEILSDRLVSDFFDELELDIVEFVEESN